MVTGMSATLSTSVLVNPTRPTAGEDAYALTSEEYMKRVTSNPGNMVFLYALRHQIAGIKHYTEEDRRGADIAVWGCSNFIHNKREVIGDHPTFGVFKMPYVAIGLGAQAPNMSFEFSIPEQTLIWLRNIIRQAPTQHPNISVRGRYTHKILTAHGMGDNCEVLGCPSLFINHTPALSTRLKEKLGSAPEKIAVAPGYVTQCPKPFEQLERSLAKITDEYGGGYICQGPEDVIRMARGEYSNAAPESIARANKVLMPRLSEPDFRKWFRRHAMVFGDVPPWMEYLRTCDILIGTRIHGALLAIQSGTPALCISLDVRQLEMCETMKIPTVWWEDVASGITAKKAYEIVREHDWDEFNDNRQRLARAYITFLKNNRLTQQPFLTKIAQSAN